MKRGSGLGFELEYTLQGVKWHFPPGSVHRGRSRWLWRIQTQGYPRGAFLGFSTVSIAWNNIDQEGRG